METIDQALPRVSSTPGAAIEATTPGGSTSGIRARLLGLFMIPVLAVGVLAGSVINAQRASASSAVAVDEGVVELSELVSLREALQTQHTVAAFQVRAEELAVTLSVVSEYLGIDLDGKVAPARAEADRAMTALGGRSPVRSTTLGALYQAIDAHAIDAPAAVGRFADQLEIVDVALAERFRRLQRDADESRLAAGLESLRISSQMMDVATQQGIDLSEVWFPAPGSSDGAAVFARFSAVSAHYDVLFARLRDLGVEGVVAQLDRMTADGSVTAFDAAVTANLLGVSVPPGGTEDPVVKDAFRGYFTRDTMLDGLLLSAVDSVRDEAQEQARSARAGLFAWSLGTAAVVVVSIGIALLLALSISRPLKDLARYAQAVNEGDLDYDPGSRDRGPRETRVAFGVLTDLVSNLQLLDAKANALAHCEFENPVLLEPLPGRLGRSLESSVALLSGSIVERDELQTHLAYEATHDALTGLCNRPAAITSVDAALNRAARSGATTAVLFIDLNEFKSINDSHGHKVGDEVLRQVAARLTSGLRSGDIAARLGGDEFVIIAEGVTGIEDATNLARRIVAAVAEPIDAGGQRVTVGAAVGIALSLDGPEEAQRLLARADAAMYRAKGHGGSAIEIFDDELQRQLREREDVEAALTAALADPTGGGLHLHYQPVMDTASGEMVSAEALLRWDRLGHGRLAPDSFIPIAEATSLIIDVDCWVLHEAARQITSWSAVPSLAAVPIAVNISGRHLLSRKLADHVREAIEGSGIDPRRLTIEITETVLLTDLAVAATELDAVRALGVQVAVDDFGTGYTSLAHLQTLPIDAIKIDRSFISQLSARRGSSLVRMVTDLGHAIDLNIVAEGVETDEEMAALKAIGADHLQGYLLSRPLEPAAFSTWAATQAVGRTAPSAA